MTKSLQIIPDWKNDSSGTGNSYWSKFQGGCPYQALLDKKYADLIKQMELEDDEATNLGVGSAFHKICEHYYKGTLDTVAFDTDNASVAEALRLFGGYSTRFPRSEFSEVVGAEYQFELSEDPTGNLEDIVGVRPFTGRVDLAVRISEADIPNLARIEGRNLPISKPGIYLIDHKTMKQKRQTAGMEFSNSFQFLAYQLCWNYLYADTLGPCLGMIANCVVRHKTLNDGSFFSIFVPPPTPAQIEATKAHFKFAKLMRDTHGEFYKNRSICFHNYGKVCSHFLSGACDRV